MTNKSVCLMGMPGSGKSTVGKLLADNLSLPFRDLDLEIEKSAKKSISQIFRDQGEAAFRKMESIALSKVLKENKAVIALGGGAVCSSENLLLIKEKTHSVYLNVNQSTLQKRLLINQNARPLLVGKSPEALLEYLHQLLNQRELFYQQADLTIDCGDFDAQEIADKIEQLI
jgi:shikimate kinase